MAGPARLTAAAHSPRASKMGAASEAMSSRRSRSCAGRVTVSEVIADLPGAQAQAVALRGVVLLHVALLLQRAEQAEDRGPGLAEPLGQRSEGQILRGPRQRLQDRQPLAQSVQGVGASHGVFR